MTADAETVLLVEDLRVETPGGAPIIDGVDIALRRAEILGVVGESGSGKTTTVLSLFGYTQAGARIVRGRFVMGGQELATWDDMRRARGADISYVPQNPGTALNPSLRVLDAIGDMLTEHGHDASGDRIADVLAKVGLPVEFWFRRRFPHQLSGGQQQRVCLAVAIVNQPPMIILDEPTTGLDVVTQAQVIDELLRLRDREGVAMVYVTHNLAVVAQIADRIAVMYAGRVVEEGPTRDVLLNPLHPYTRGLVASIPDHLRPRRIESLPGIVAGVGERPPGCAFAPRCRQRQPDCELSVPPLAPTDQGQVVRCLHWDQTPRLGRESVDLEVREVDDLAESLLEVHGLRAEHHSREGTVIAADDINFTISRGECLAIVGESGSGKTTIARAIAGLHRIAAGRMALSSAPLADRASKRTVEQRRQIQMIFQNSTEALNPRQTIFEAIVRPILLLRGLRRRDAEAEVSALLERVRLPAQIARLYPTEVSGGERQRVAIARALATKPNLLVCDEITSALDVSVQAAVLELLAELRAELVLSVLFITHDLGVVAMIADHVLVLNEGKICERGSVAKVLSKPQAPYTQRLLAAAPSLSALYPDFDARGRAKPVGSAFLHADY